MKIYQIFRHIYFRSFFYSFILLFLYSFTGLSSVYAQSCDPTCGDVDQCKQKIAKCQEAWNMMETALRPHVETLRKMEADIAAFQNQIKSIEAAIVKKTQGIAEGEASLGELVGLASKRIRQQYIRTLSYNPLVFLFSGETVGSAMRAFGYQQAVTTRDKNDIAHTAALVKELEDRKRSLEQEKGTLASLKSSIDAKAVSVRKLVGEASAYQTKLTGIIASLSAQQQAILSARSGTFTTSVGDVPIADDPNSAPTYNPGFSPAFAGFSFGAYTHRKGMSQYGAKGRAESGQNYQDILRAYYNTGVVNKDTGGTISVQGVGAIDFEGYYLLGIAEMPSTFPKEALRAQAIAARSYAWSYKSSGKTICTTEACQVFSSGKANNVPNEWREAVNDTRGQIVEGVTAFYSSTTGGYSTTSGWDTKCGSQGCWTGDAYEKIAGSPWFYKGWYTSGYYTSSNKCNRNHPWLSQDEFADILNAWQVRKHGSAEDAKRVLPVTINSCGIGGVSGNPYSIDEMRSRAGESGGSFTSVGSISVTYNSGGYTDTVILQTNRGEVRIPGSEFKDTFNLRAPGYLSIRSPLFNIEKK